MSKNPQMLKISSETEIKEKPYESHADQRAENKWHQ